MLSFKTPQSKIRYLIESVSDQVTKPTALADWCSLIELKAKELGCDFTDHEMESTKANPNQPRYKVCLRTTLSEMSEKGVMEWWGKGLYAPIVETTEVEDIELQEIEALAEERLEQAGESSGVIYAFHYPGFESLIKVGHTTNWQARWKSHLQGAKNAAVPTRPRPLAQWVLPPLPELLKIEHVEKAVHIWLRARGKGHNGHAGVEWFKASLEDVDEAVCSIMGCPIDRSEAPDVFDV